MKYYEFESFKQPLNQYEFSKLLEKVFWKNCKIDLSQFDDLIVYGCGDLGRLCREYCVVEGIKISGYVDQNNKVLITDGYWQNIDIQPPEYLLDLDPNKTLILCCIVTVSQEKIFAFLKKFGMLHIVPFYDFVNHTQSIYPLNNGWYADESSYSFDKFQKILTRLQDPTSKCHYLSFLAWRFMRHEWIFDDCQINNDNRFFIDEVIESLRGKQTILDIGAHVGRVALKFEGLLKDDLQSVDCYEPDDVTRAALLNNVDELANDPSKFKIQPHAVSSVTGKVCFIKGFNYASKIDHRGDLVPSMKIDDMSLNPTIIKIHTEGSEHEILVGGLYKINHSRPIVMATIYHNFLGLSETLELLMKNLIDYNFLFRLHSWCATSAVIYCIPKKESKP